mmetsp:Transcript_33692/g.75675  ORF Transcript_33692/g.75675 Transcript_33692/m.75675 type:complete len:254 (-) Transcript_33692:667-1428(-)
MQPIVVDDQRRAEVDQRAVVGLRAEAVRPGDHNAHFAVDLPSVLGLGGAGDPVSQLLEGAEGDVRDHGLADVGHVRHIGHKLKRLVVCPVHPHQPLRRRRKRGSSGRQADHVPVLVPCVRTRIGCTLISPAVVVEAFDAHCVVARGKLQAAALPLTSVQAVVVDQQTVVDKQVRAVVRGRAEGVDAGRTDRYSPVVDPHKVVVWHARNNSHELLVVGNKDIFNGLLSNERQEWPVGLRHVLDARALEHPQRPC